MQQFIDALKPDVENLLNTVPPVEWPLMWFYIGFNVLLLAIAIASLFPWKFLRPATQARISSLAWTNIFISLVILPFRLGGVPLLGMDLWRVLQEVSAVLWVAAIVGLHLKENKAYRTKAAVAEYQDKYLPKPKKHRFKKKSRA